MRCNTSNVCEHNPIGALCNDAKTPCRIEWFRSPIKEWVSIDKFVPHLMSRLARSKESLKIDLTETPAELMLDDIRGAAIEFCQRVPVLKRWLGFDIQRGVVDYYPTLCGAEQIQFINRVVVTNGRSAIGQWNRGVEYNVGRAEAHGSTYCGSYGPASFWFLPPGTLMASPAPFEDCYNAVSVEAVATPVRDACDFDALLYTRHLDAIINGAAARVMKVASPALAKGFSQDFEFEVSRAANAAFSGNTQRSGRMMNNRAVG
jgi:hypothetical protein